MKLFMFQSGAIRTKKHLLVEGPDNGERFEVPVPFYLIMHQDGNVLFDTGQHMAAAECTATGNYIPVMNEADHVVCRLAEIGLKTTDITHIVLSHLHADHAGGLEAFSNQVCYIQKAELQAGDNRSMLDKYPLQWHCLNGDHDVFGDGRVRLVSTPGHSPGHQSLLLKLEKTGKVFLASDSIYLDEILDRNILPGVYYDRTESMQTIQMIRDIRKRGIMVISGHDPEAWNNLRLAPGCYE